jgi:hypothetical protein
MDTNEFYLKANASGHENKKSAQSGRGTDIAPITIHHPNQHQSYRNQNPRLLRLI